MGRYGLILALLSLLAMTQYAAAMGGKFPAGAGGNRNMYKIIN